MIPGIVAAAVIVPVSCCIKSYIKKRKMAKRLTAGAQPQDTAGQEVIYEDDLVLAIDNAEIQENQNNDYEIED